MLARFFNKAYLNNKNPKLEKIKNKKQPAEEVINLHAKMLYTKKPHKKINPNRGCPDLFAVGEADYCK